MAKRTAAYVEPFKWPLDVSVPEDPQTQNPLYFVLGRKLNLEAFPQGSSLYSLLRAWIQDDPYKPPVQLARRRSHEVELVLPSPADGPPGGPEGEAAGPGPSPACDPGLQQEASVDNNIDVSPEVLLQCHIAHGKKVKEWHRRARARRRARFRARLALLGVPEDAQILRLLSGHKQSGTNGRAEALEDEAVMPLEGKDDEQQAADDDAQQRNFFNPDSMTGMAKDDNDTTMVVDTFEKVESVSRIRKKIKVEERQEEEEKREEEEVKNKQAKKSSDDNDEEDGENTARNSIGENAEGKEGLRPDTSSISLSVIVKEETEDRKEE
mmetsp:Transcript_23046/g.37267  ORF Transcript_23046/g.37267 Transcript_23046/m.37267 type:complete len:324 (+) Transcript_23046:41-1012(+)|eukprot:CAMPEP_0194573784 /NCGR_PEP_ID=MMETSP0292-20121207/9873_1 /TAXON_ID=39354 /ORGANISM="Heterosigma akashiwo, Strain CCMP2393" /LENGTH=323 /DNA_ID=CAMNT_0039425127 /DNA_START=17 /DNA_END=988 /DNA_ORIENTATION=+